MTKEDINRENLFLNVIFDKNQQILALMDQVDQLKREKPKKQETK